METVCNKVEKSMKEIKVTFTTEEWKKAQAKALDKLAKTVRLDGFRNGKAPIQLVKARLGKRTILEEATDLILKENYTSLLSENEVVPVAQPTISIDELSEEVLKITLTAQVAPEFTLGEYKGLEVKKGAVRVTKNEIEAEIKNQQASFAELTLKEEGTVENGDTAVIDFEGFKDGVAFEGGKGENHPLEIGSGTFIPGFEEQLIGMGIGEEKEIEVTFPQDYQAEELAGQLTTFKVKVHEIKTKVLPEIDDELAKDLNIEGVETLEQLEAYTKEQIRTRKQKEVENKFEEELFNALLATTELEVPESYVSNELDYMMNEVEQNLARQGLNLELFQQFTGKTVENMREEMYEQAENRVKFNLIVSEIARAENIEISDEEVEKEISRIAAQYEKEVEEVKTILNGQSAAIKSDLANRKALELVKANLK